MHKGIAAIPTWRVEARTAYDGRNVSNLFLNLW